MFIIKVEFDFSVVINRSSLLSKFVGTVVTFMWAYRLSWLCSTPSITKVISRYHIKVEHTYLKIIQNNIVTTIRCQSRSTSYSDFSWATLAHGTHIQISDYHYLSSKGYYNHTPWSTLKIRYRQNYFLVVTLRILLYTCLLWQVIFPGTWLRKSIKFQLIWTVIVTSFTRTGFNNINTCITFFFHQRSANFSPSLDDNDCLRFDLRDQFQDH